MTKNEAAYYLSAMIDGEGHIGLTRGMRKCNYRYKKETPYVSRQVVIYNCDEDLIDACIDCLYILGVEFKYYSYERNQDGWSMAHELRITNRAGFERLAEVLHLKSKKKRKALRDIVGSYEPITV